MNLMSRMTTARTALGLRIPLVLLVVLAGGVWTPASAQIARVGETKTLVNTNPHPLIGNDVAFDPDDDIYLSVIAQGDVFGAFSNVSGDLLVGFRIGGTNRNYPFGAYPRTAYSPELNGGQGGFLVTWHQPEVGSFANVVHAAVAAHPAGIVSPIRVISTNVPGVPLQGGSFANAGATIAYSPTSHRFLVAWTTALKGVQGRFVSAVTGEPIGGVMQLVDANPAGGQSHPELAWNPATDEFGLSYAGWGGSGAFVGFKRIRAADGATSAPTSFAFSLGTFCPDIDVNPATGNYVVGWSRGAGALGAEFDRNGAMLTSPSGFLVSTRVGTPVSFSLALNPASGTALAVSEDNASFEVAGIELNGSGVPIGAATALTGASTASWVPRVTARPDARQWNVSSSRHKVTLANQIVSSGSVDTPPPPPPPPGSVPRMAIDVPRANATLTGTVVVAGWAIDFGSGSGTGVDAVDVYAALVGGGTPTLLGRASYGIGRGDVAAAFGNSRFTPSGFVFSGALAPGTYDVIVQARSVVTGTFNNSATVRVTVAGAQSVPRMWVDIPAQNQTVKTAFTVAGWALDLGAPTGTGVNAVHVWAYPVSPTGVLGTPRPVGLAVATLGQSRPDVGAAFGSSRFSTSGFVLNGALEPGVYNMAVFAKSTITETFNNVSVVRINVIP